MSAASVMPDRALRALPRSSASTVVLRRMRFMPSLCHQMHRGDHRGNARWRTSSTAIAVGSTREGGGDVGVDEIVADKKQWLACHVGERIGVTVTQVKCGRMPATSPEVAVSPACYSSLLGIEGHELD